MPVRSDVSDGDLGGSTKVTVGIDQSYTGFAVTVQRLDGKAHHTVCRSLTGKGVGRLQDAQGLVLAVVDAYEGRIAEVGLEGYAFGASQNAHMAGELGAAVLLALAERGITPLRPTPAQVKKFATGRGNAKKAEVLLGVYKNWGVEFTDDNMADSYVISRILCGEGSNKEQRAVVDLVMKSRGAN